MDESTTTARACRAPPRELFVWVYVRRAGRRRRGRLGAASPTATAPHAEPHLPWWAVALGFAAAELCVVHVRFRRSAHSF